jgi:hypothetical protein
MYVAAAACATIDSVVPKVGCVAALVGPRRHATASQVFFLGWVLCELIHTCSQARLLSLLFTIGFSIGFVSSSSLLPPQTLLSLRMPCTYPRYFFWVVTNCLCSLRRLGVGPVSYVEGATFLCTQSMFDVVYFVDSDDAVYVPTVFHWVVTNCLCSLRRLGVGPVSYVEGASFLCTQSMFDGVYFIDSDDAVYVPTVFHWVVYSVFLNGVVNVPTAFQWVSSFVDFDDAVYVPTVFHWVVVNCLCFLSRLGAGSLSFVEVASFLCSQSFFEVVYFLDFDDAVYVPSVFHWVVVCDHLSS